MADMFMQVFIERDRRYQISMVTVHLYFLGVPYLKSLYPDKPIKTFRHFETKAKSFCCWPLLFPASDMEQNEIMLTREEIYDAIWKTPMCHLCKAWSIPVYRLSKICEQFGIPRPGADYWPLLRLNHATERTPLPPVAPNQPSVIRIKPHLVQKVTKSSSQQIQPVAMPSKNELPDSRNNLPPSDACSMVTVAQDFRKAHPLIRASRELLAGR